MKKAFFMFVAVFAISCSSSSDSSDSSSIPDDPIVGTWKLVSETEQKGIGAIVPRNLSVCELEQTQSYYVGLGRTAIQLQYQPNAVGGCTLYATTNADWIKTGNNLYKLTNLSNGDPDVLARVTFSNNNNAMEFATQDGSYTIYQMYNRQ